MLKRVVADGNITRRQRITRFAIFVVLLATLGLGTVACGSVPATPSPSPVAPPAPVVTPSVPVVTPPPVPPATTTTYTLPFRDSKWERVPIDLKKGDIVVVLVDVPTPGQIMAVGLEDPAGGGLVFQPVYFDYRPEIAFKAETDGRHNIVVAQGDLRGGIVAVTIKHYPVGS